MARDITLNKTGSVTGSGTKTIGFGWGANTSRAGISRIYTVPGGSNRLLVSQQYAALSNVVVGSASQSVVLNGSTQTVTFTGRANGKYLKYTVGNGLTASLTESSGGSAHSIGTSYTQVSNFLGGSQMYDYTLSVSVPASTSDGSYNVTVSTADETSPSSEQTTSYSIAVTSVPVAVVSVNVLPTDGDIAVGGTAEYRAEITPSNATISSYAWSIDTDYATVQGNGSTCVVTGVAQGRTVVGVNVTDTQGNTVYGHGNVSVWRAGSISASDVSIYSNSDSASTVLTATDMDDTRGFTITSAPSWVFLENPESYVDTTSTPYRVRLKVSTNIGNTPRSGSVVVSGYDNLGIQRTCSFTLAQEANTVIAVTGITVNGASSIADSGNTARYVASFSPANTTQKGCTWSVSGAGAQYVSINSALSSQCDVTVLSGASGETVRLTATSTHNSQVYGYVDISVTYVSGSSSITVSDYSLDVMYSDTYLDRTNGAPTVTTTNLDANSLAVTDITGFITNASLVEYNNNIYLTFTFPTNDDTTQARTGTVKLIGTSNGVPVDPVYVTLTQSMAPSQSDALSVDAFSIEQGARMNLTLEVTYYNNHTTATTFYQPRWVLYGAESQGQSFTEILSSNLGDIADKVVSSSSSETAQYTYSSHTTLGMYTWFKVVFTTQSPELTANKEGDGTDVINVE